MSRDEYSYLYDKQRWRSPKYGLRALQLRKKPLCKYCDDRGLVTLAMVADHVVPHKGDEQLFFDPDNLQSLCKRCHDSLAAYKDAGKLLPGCNADGTPTDPNHPWNK